MARDFNSWLSTFRESIADYKYYIDFGTVYKNIEEYGQMKVLIFGESDLSNMNL